MGFICGDGAAALRGSGASSTLVAGSLISEDSQGLKLEA